MTNPDREELVKLADRMAALPTFKMATVVTVPGVACDERERDLIVTALRRLASSDSGVKGFVRNCLIHCREVGEILFMQTREGQWIASLDGYAIIPREKYNDLVAPPADAGMREALVGLNYSLDRYWEGDRSDNRVKEICDWQLRCRDALTAPGATTKSDGGVPASVGLHWKLSDDAKQRLAEIDAAIVRPGDPRLNQIIGGPSPIPFTGYSEYTPVTVRGSTSDPSSTRSGRWVCAARQRGITLDPQDCDWPVCGCDPLANKVLDTIAESGFVIVPKDGAPMADDQIKHMVDRFLMWQLPENFNPDAGISYTRPNWPAINEAIASFEGDAVERVALPTMRVGDTYNSRIGPVTYLGLDHYYGETTHKFEVPGNPSSHYERPGTLRNFLATGLVPDEAAIRKGSDQ